MSEEIPLKNEIEETIRECAELEAVASTKGGKKLIKNLQKDIANAISTIAGGYKTLSHIELIAYCATLSERLEIWQTFLRASKNKKIAIEDLEKFYPKEDKN